MRITLILILALALLAGCAARQAFNDGRELIDAGEFEQGLAKIDAAAKLDPQQNNYRQQYFLQRDAALQRIFTLGESARQQGQTEQAEALYQRMLGIDPQSARAKAGIDTLALERRSRMLLAEAENLLKKGDEQKARSIIRQVLAESGNQREALVLMRKVEERALRAASAGPELSAALKRPITLEFRDTPLRTVFELVSKNTGLNFIFDRDVRADLRTTIFVRNTSIEDVLRFLMVTNQLERKVLNQNTLLVYPNTAAKLRDYQDLVVKTFYLGNADVKIAANLIRTMVKTKDVHIDEKLNMLVMRDTPEAIRVAERLIATQDLAEAEVMLEVEVLEVGSTALTDLGIRFPDQISYSAVGAAGVGGSLTLPELQNRNASLVRVAFTNPLLVLNLRDQEGRANLLANPRIRVKSKDKARIHIGDKVPVITATTTATGVISESVNYLDVGLKLDVEPTVFLENDVGIKIGMEVSNIVREIRSNAGTLTYQVGTRNATTNLRLRDGETQILAGLISDEDRRTANQIPGLGDLPLVGRIFGSHSNTKSKTEIVLLITPRIVRNLVRPELQFEEFPAGTEAAVGAAPLLLQSLPLTGDAPAPAATPTRPLSDAPAPPAVRLGLQGPANLLSGQEFTVQLTVDALAALRGALVDLVFDPSRLRLVRAAPGALIANSPDAAFRFNAPEGLGRLSISLATKSDIKGAGELARITFQQTGPPVGAPSLRVEAATVTDGGGKVLTGQLPAPLAMTIRNQ